MNFSEKNLFQLLKNLIKSMIYDNKSFNSYILYKIVDYEFKNGQEYYKIQCINTKAVIKLTIEEIAFDITILHGLHPIQGCFVGIEYSKIIRLRADNKIKKNIKLHHFSEKNLIKRYGYHELEFQDRTGRLGFRHCITNQILLMDPRDIALSQVLIAEFDAAQAFCIGVLAGFKLNNSISISQNSFKKAKHLQLIK